MDKNIELFYKEKQDQLSSKVGKYDNINKYIALAKLTSFLFGIFLFVFWYFNSIFNILFLSIPFIIYFFFFIFGQKYIDLYNKYKSLHDLISDEISFLNKDYNVFRNNIEFMDYNHNYAYDLDIFEKGSIYHSINRCTTLDGENFLKDLILAPKKENNEILRMQEAIKEMAPLRDLSHNISAISYKKPSSLKDFLNLINENIIPPKKSALIYSYISSAITLSALILYLLGLIPSAIPLGLFIYQFIVASIFSKKINDKYSTINKGTNAARIYLSIHNALKDIDFKSDILKEIKEELANINIEIKKLEKITKEFNQRNSGLYYLLSNGFLLKDISLAYKMNKWIKSNKEKIPSWNKAIAYIDGINSLSVFAFNNSDFIFPSINNDCIIKAENLSHPIIDKSKRVGNNIEISKTHTFLIITGANMAGKSTFIRSIGVNLILASMGAPVCATSFEFSSVDIFSSMRTSDKLMESSSYFHAELKRLKALKKWGEKSDKMLILLDEILKGTNSQDKLSGSKLVLLKFIQFNIAGILATHDTKLGKLAEEYKDNFQNYFFDFNVDENGEMHFDYKLKEGVSNNMNASLLLKNVIGE